MVVMTIVDGSDWSGVYIDDDLIFEGHSLDPFFVAELAVDRRVEGVVRLYADIEWLEDRGDLPANLFDVKLGAVNLTPEMIAAATQVGAA